MKFHSANFYHIFNRGNNKQSIFPQEKNYAFFKSKIEDLISPCCEIVAYCLMPNHFHLLVYTNETGVAMISNGTMQQLERKIGTLQSSYTRAINIQEKKTGSLFQANCKIIALSNNHPFICFHYILQNPLKAGLVNALEDWKYSSYTEYLLSIQGICNKEIAYDLLDIASTKSLFHQQSRSVISYEL